jgi:hypothetical protein
MERASSRRPASRAARATWSRCSGLGVGLGSPGELRPQRPQRRWRAVDVGVSHGLGRQVAERGLAAEQLEGEDRQRIAISRLRWGQAFKQLRGHVGDGAHRDVRGGSGVLHRAGNAEVEQRGVVGVVDEDVGRLDVAVQHLLVVGVPERIGKLADDGRRACGRKWATGPQEMMERPAFEQGHREVVLAVGLADVEDAHDAGVLQ